MSSILLTNDDGPRSAPFTALLLDLSRENRVRTVIPSRERSWIGKSITPGVLPPPRSMDVLGHDVILVDGTPADCVQVGLHNIFKESPEMVVSGMNIGENVGIGRMLSSGTLGGALEAAILGIRAVSVSVVIPREVRKNLGVRDPGSYQQFIGPASIACSIISRSIEQKLWEDFQVVSMNIPFGAGPDTEVEVTRPSLTTYGQLFKDRDGDLVHSNPRLEDETMAEGTDALAVMEGRVSITPINIDMVKESAIDNLKRTLIGGR